jgi:hypothetical protein
MPINEIIIKSVKKMVDAGLSDAAINSALDDLGISAEEKAQALAQAKGAPATETLKEVEEDAEVIESDLEATDAEEQALAPQHEIIAEATAQKVKQHLQEKEAVDSFRETTTHVALDEHTRLLQEHHALLQALKTELSGSSSNGGEHKQMVTRIAGLEKNMKELQAHSKATQELLKQILEATRKMLGKL